MLVVRTLEITPDRKLSTGAAFDLVRSVLSESGTSPARVRFYLQDLPAGRRSASATLLRRHPDLSPYAGTSLRATGRPGRHVLTDLDGVVEGPGVALPPVEIARIGEIARGIPRSLPFELASFVFEGVQLLGADLVREAAEGLFEPYRCMLRGRSTGRPSLTLTSERRAGRRRVRLWATVIHRPGVDGPGVPPLPAAIETMLARIGRLEPGIARIWPTSMEMGRQDQGSGSTSPLPGSGRRRSIPRRLAGVGRTSGRGNRAPKAQSGERELSDLSAGVGPIGAVPALPVSVPESRVTEGPTDRGPRARPNPGAVAGRPRLAALLPRREVAADLEDPLLILDLVLDGSVDACRPLLEARFADWSELPSVRGVPRLDRKQQPGSGHESGDGRTPLDTMARAMVSNLQGFRFENGMARVGGCCLEKPVSDELAVAVVWRACPGNGHNGVLCQLDVGLRLARAGQEEGLVVRELPAWFGRGDRVAWALDDGDDVERAIEEGQRFLSALLPELERALKDQLDPRGLLPTVAAGPFRRLSAREALRLAEEALTSWDRDAALVGARPGRRDRCRDSVSLDGRLRPNGSWCFDIRSANRDRRARLEIPAIGRARLLPLDLPANRGAVPIHGEAVFTGEPLSAFSPWMDSTEAVRMVANDPELVGRIGAATRISRLELRTTPHPHWLISLSFEDGREPRQSVAAVDATD